MNRRPQYHMSEVASQLHSIIQKSPGIHFRSLGREAHLSSVGQLRHHLDSLRRQGAIVELEDGRFKRYFAAGAHEPRIRKGLARFSRPIPKRIAMLLLNRPMNRTEIRRSLGCADSTLGYHLNRMVELGDLTRDRGRNCCLYSLTEPDFIRDLLQYQCGSPPKKERKHWSDQDHAGVLGGPEVHDYQSIPSSDSVATNDPVADAPKQNEPVPAVAEAARNGSSVEGTEKPVVSPSARDRRRNEPVPSATEQENTETVPPKRPENSASRLRNGAEVPAWLRHW